VFNLKKVERERGREREREREFGDFRAYLQID